MPRLLKCKYCSEFIDPETTAYEKVGNRYAHQSCASNITSESVQRKQLTDYIDKLYKGKVNWPLVGKQIQSFLAQGYTLTGLYYTLQYLYEIRKEDISKAHGGIGFIPYKYNEAREYYRRENNNFTMAKKITNNEVKVAPKTTSQVLITKKILKEKKDKLLNLDI